jgi:DNA-binding response OmpR family regulator
MSVDKDQGDGSVVYLRRPAASRLSANDNTSLSADATASDTEPVGAKLGLVLIIDDEPQIRQVSKRFLELLGYAVEQAQNAYEGLALFAARHDEFSAVILDLKMPGKDGWECLAELREVRARIPIIICSGYDPEVSQLARSRRHIAFLKKPFRMNDLAAVLRDLVDAPGRRER